MSWKGRQSLRILATLGFSDWISSAACKIASMLVARSSDGGIVPAIPLGVLSWPGPELLSCSLLSVARTNLSQFLLAMAYATIRRRIKTFTGSNELGPLSLSLWLSSYRLFWFQRILNWKERKRKGCELRVERKQKKSVDRGKGKMKWKKEQDDEITILSFSKLLGTVWSGFIYRVLLLLAIFLKLVGI